MKNVINLERNVFFLFDIKFSSEKSIPITYVVYGAMNFNKSKDESLLLVNAAKTPLGFDSSNDFGAHEISIHYIFSKKTTIRF